MSKAPLTEHQKWAIEEIRKKHGAQWFHAFDIPSHVHRADFTCETLQKKGYLEQRYDRDTSSYLYRIIEEPTP